MFRHGPSCLEGPVSRKTGRRAAVRPSAGQRPFRPELVARIRREIAAGTYETPEKWEAALERLYRSLS
jgi:hypothetical protein